MEPDPSRPAPSRPVLERLVEWVRWFGAGRLVVGAIAMVVVAVASFWLVRSPPPATESTLPYASTSSTSAGAPGATTTVAMSGGSASSSTPSELVVHVAGAVIHPGVYRLAPGARAVDAVAAAGGMAQDANADAVNLAAEVHDGERVYVPAEGEAVPVVATETGTTAVPGPVDLNAATAAELDTLPGVGPSTASAIIAYRDQHGPFQSVDELGEVRGIGPAKLEALTGLVTV